MTTEPNSVTRHILAVLDTQIIELADTIVKSRVLADEAVARADRLEAIQTELMSVRSKMHPMLDPSAPTEFPYDKRHRP